MTKNLFLYINSSKNSNICNQYKDIYCFGSSLVAIDKNAYNKNNRFNLQKQLNVYPYYITQSIFKDILRSLAYNKINISLMNISFIDDKIDETIEYDELQDIIANKDNIKIYEYTLQILDEYDTEIKKIKFVYKKMILELTNEGILNFQSKDDLLGAFIADTSAKNLLLGKI